MKRHNGIEKLLHRISRPFVILHFFLLSFLFLVMQPRNSAEAATEALQSNFLHDQYLTKCAVDKFNKLIKSTNIDL